MITGGQHPAGTVPTFLTQVPPGPGQLFVWSPGTIFAGFGTTVTTSSGCQVPAGGLSALLFQGSAGTPLYVIASGTTTASWLVSNSQ